jgi:hypothetical protein
MPITYSSAPLNVATRTRYVNTLAELRALTGTSLSGTVKMLGFATIGDGGGGDWYWDSASAATDNTGTIVKPNSVSTGAGRWRRLHDISLVNVKWFGARGDHASSNTQAGLPDNGTDDTAAFQAAIDSTGLLNAEATVYVPFAGVLRSYKITNTLRLYQGSRLIGSAEQPGQYPELAFYVGDTVDGIAPNNVGVSFPSRIKIKGLRIREYSTSITRQNIGVRMDHVANGYKIENVMVSGFQDAFFVGSTFANVGDVGSMTDCWAVNYVRYGLRTRQLDNAHIFQDLKFDSNVDDARGQGVKSIAAIHIGSGPQEAMLSIMGVKHEAGDDSHTIVTDASTSPHVNIKSVVRRFAPPGGQGDVIRMEAVPTHSWTIENVSSQTGRSANLLNIPGQGFAIPGPVGAESSLKRLHYYANGKGYVINRGDVHRTSSTQYEPEYQCFDTPLTTNRNFVLPGGPNGMINGKRFIITKNTDSGPGKLIVINGANGETLGEIPANARGKIAVIWDGKVTAAPGWQLIDYEIFDPESRYSTVGHSHVIQDFVSEYVPQRLYAPNLYYGPQTSFATGTLTNTALVANSLWAVPFLLTEQHNFDQIGISVSTAGAAGGLARLGIYEAGANGLPGALVQDAGTVTTDTTGVKIITIGRLLQPNLYFLALVADVPATVCHAPASVSMVGTSAITSSAVKAAYANRAFTYGALPDPWGTPTAYVNSGPMISMRLQS